MKDHLNQLRDQDLLDEEASARLLQKLTGQHVTARMLETYRSGKRARPLRFVRQFGGSRGRVMYRVSDLRAFAQGEVGPGTRGDLLPRSWLTSGLPAAELDWAHHLLRAGRRAPGTFGAVPHAARIDHEIGAALASMRGLVNQAGRTIIERMAVWTLGQERGGIAGASPDAVVDAIREVAASFDRQLAAWRDEKESEAAALTAIVARHRPLLEAVGKRFCALIDERARTARARDALGLGRNPSASLRADMTAAGVPDALIQQALKAASAGTGDVPVEFADLNQKVGALGEQIELLMRFSLAEPGDYSALATFPEFDSLIAAEHAARAEEPAASSEAAKA